MTKLKVRERAALVGLIAGRAKRLDAERSLDELAGLAEAAGAAVVLRVLQERPRADPSTFLGAGKVATLAASCAETDADVVVFDAELTPAQLRQIEEAVHRKVIDRTQLILDIFAQRAMTREGKIQVELAQLKYLLPRLSGSGTEMSRLMGGIGGRGPGETKLEVDRRRARDRISLLEKEITHIRTGRQTRRTRRERREVPIISIVGYTNAGKSTLLNALTRSNVNAENKLFATLDPTSRRLRLPRDREVVINDTVGFIRDLPPDLIAAFRATLEEIESSDLLIHLVDGSSPQVDSNISVVEGILDRLGLGGLRRLLVFNKRDLLSADEIARFERAYGAVVISARDSSTLTALIDRVGNLLEHPALTPQAPAVESAAVDISDKQIESRAG